MTRLKLVGIWKMSRADDVTNQTLTKWSPIEKSSNSTADILLPLLKWSLRNVIGWTGYYDNFTVGKSDIFLSFVHLLSHLPTYLFLIKNFEVCNFYVFKEESDRVLTVNEKICIHCNIFHCSPCPKGYLQWILFIIYHKKYSLFNTLILVL